MVRPGPPPGHDPCRGRGSGDAARECLPLAGALPLLPVAVALGELARRDGGGLLAAPDGTPELRGEMTPST